MFGLNMRIAWLALGAVAAGCTLGAKPHEPGDPASAEPDSAAVAQIAQNLDVEVTYTLVRERDTLYLGALVTYTNRGEERVFATTPMCQWWFKAYRSPERAGTPIWDLEDHLFCGPDLEEIIDLAPGASDTAGGTLGSVAQILGGNPPGTYYFTVQLELSQPRGRTREYPAGEVVLPAPGGGG